LSATGVATFSAGTVSAPAITTTGDTNTGIYFPAADTIAFTEGGAEAMRIDSGGNLLVGYTGAAPAKLYVAGTGWIDNGSDSANIFYVNAGGEPSLRLGQIGSVSYISAATSGGQSTSLVFQTAVGSGSITEKMRIDSSGNVGIGTSSPSSILNVKSSAPIFRLETTGAVTSTGTAYNAIRDSSGSDVFTNGFLGLANCYQFGTTFANGFMRFLTGTATEAMRIDTSGNVGVGTTSPNARLHIQDGSNGGTLQLGSTAVDLGTSTINMYGASNVINFKHRNIGTTLASITGAPANFGTDSSGYLAFDTQTAAGTPTERMRITSSGNVGIGTSSPSQKFQIAGGSIQLDTATSVAFGNINTRMQGASDGSFIWYGSGTERMRIDSSGNVGIGTTSPGAKLQVEGSVVVSGTNTINATSCIMTIGDSTRTASSSTTTGAIVCGGGLGVWSQVRTGGTIYVNTTADNPGISGIQGVTLVESGYMNACRTGPVFYSSHLTTGNSFEFRANGTTLVGTISVTGSNTAYNTSSDYRLKENIAPMVGALARVAQLKPVTYKWKSDGSDSEGFIAHELAEVCPHAVTGEKDATETVEVKDEKGNVTGTEVRPVYQGIDVSFLVATLTAAIQELKAEFDAYKSTHP
jgi:hypothetical protein